MKLERVQLLQQCTCQQDPSPQCPPRAGTECPFLPISLSCLLPTLPAQPWAHSGLGGPVGAGLCHFSSWEHVAGAAPPVLPLTNAGALSCAGQPRGPGAHYVTTVSLTLQTCSCSSRAPICT